jgi:hypothetical protein
MLTSRLTLGPWIMPMVEALVRAAVIGLVILLVDQALVSHYFLL